MGIQPTSDLFLEAQLGQPDPEDSAVADRRLLGSLRRGLPIFSGLMLALFILAGIFGPLIAPHDPVRIDLHHSLQPPVFSGGNWTYPLGTDVLGRDVLSRMLGGARISFLVALTVVFLSGAIGLAVAVLSGYIGGAVDAVLMRITDATLAFPIILLAIVLASIFGASTQNVIIILAAGGWASYARVIRSEVLSLKNYDFVTMAVVMGGDRWWIIRRHIIPNVLSSLVVLATLQVGAAILSEGSMSFLGIGVPPPAPSWGGMLADGSDYITVAWWLAVLPGVALSLTVLASNLMGDWLRSQSDPTRRR
jgi:peptide/nickel transport system permease protein